MNGIRGHSCQQAILYVRVSTQGQVRSGYSLAQQLEALREYATCRGYEVLEEVVDLGESGVSLERPGMGRMRNLVAAGGVSVVLAQDLDRLVREPEHYHLLRHEFEEKGCRLELLNDLGPIRDQFAKYEQVKIAERTRKGKLRKAHEGKIGMGPKPNYGFRFNEARDGYEVDEGAMQVVRRIFHMVGVEQRALNAVKRALESEGVLTPSGKRRWVPWVIRGFILDDVYKPHTFEEIIKLVTPQVAARLEPDKRYGTWWYNRERWLRRQVSEVSDSGRVYRRMVKAIPNPREEWIAVPVPDSGVPRETVETARQAVLKNKPNSNGSGRFWELSGGILRCGACGRSMRTCVARKPSKLYFYYACAKHREESDACPNRKNYRADALEPAVWKLASGLLAEPEQVRAGFETLVQLERDNAQGYLEREAEVWLGRLADTARMRSGYQEMAARGLMNFDELGTKLDEVEITRRTALRELRAARDRRKGIEELERNGNTLLEYHAGSPPEALESLKPEERHQIYRLLRLQVLLGADGSLTVTGIPSATSLKSF